MRLQATIIALGCATAAVVGALAAADHYRKKAASEARRADAAVAGEQLATATNTITERFHTRTIEIREIAEPAADAVEAIPSDDLPADVRGSWLDGLRVVAPDAFDDQGGGQPSGEVQAP